MMNDQDELSPDGRTLVLWVESDGRRPRSDEEAPGPFLADRLEHRLRGAWRALWPTLAIGLGVAIRALFFRG